VALRHPQLGQRNRGDADAPGYDVGPGPGVLDPGQGRAGAAAAQPARVAGAGGYLPAAGPRFCVRARQPRLPAAICEQPAAVPAAAGGGTRVWGSTVWEHSKQMYRTGQTYHDQETPVVWQRTPADDPEASYFSHTFQVRSKAGGQVCGVYIFALDVSK